MTPTPFFHCSEFFVFRGVFFCRGAAFDPNSSDVHLTLVLNGSERIPVPAEQCCLPSPDIAQKHGPQHASCRFEIRMPLFDSSVSSAICGQIAIELRHGAQTTLIDNPARHALSSDAALQLGNRFQAELRRAGSGTFVELGARARSGRTYWGGLPDSIRYIGFDIVPGPNVDVVGDVHELSRYFDRESVDFACSLATFEHLAMPWKAAVELNRVLKPGGIVFVMAPQTWPTHEEPHDFHRFSKWAWNSLFNARTGYEIVEVAQGMPCHVVPYLYVDSQVLDDQPGWLLSAVLARKTGDSELDWNLSEKDLLGDSKYPA